MEPRTPAPASLLRDLDDAQRHAVTVPASPLAILAGPGAGKTRVLTRRIAWQAESGALDPTRVLAVTFTRKAAGELRSRLARLGLRDDVTAGTFHGLALAQLRARADDAGRRFPTVLADKVPMLLRLDGGRDPLARDRARAAARAVEWAKANSLDPAAFPATARAAGRNDILDPDELGARYAAYETERRRRGVVDFDDLLALTADALETDADLADLIHWRFRHVFVDEFQDLTAAQLRLLRAWLAGGASLCVVGDPQQAIYHFAGADPSHLSAFSDHFPGAVTVQLTRNYRSRPEIITVTRAALGTLETTAPAAPADNPPAPEPMRRPTLTEYTSDVDELHALVARLFAARDDGSAWRHHAVLARTNAIAETVARHLRASGVPCRVRIRDADPADAEFAGAATDAVDVLTFHRAKGLEWPQVHLVALEDGIVPVTAATDPEALAEERRLFAVATSRAKSTLHLSYARSRTQYGRTNTHGPSPFLAAVRDHVTPGTPFAPSDAGATADAGPRRAISAARARLAALGATRADAPARRALEEWRRRQARAANVEPAVILTDHTLGVTARARPTTTAELVAIPGLRPRWVERFGPGLLAALAAVEPTEANTQVVGASR